MAVVLWRMTGPGGWGRAGALVYLAQSIGPCKATVQIVSELSHSRGAQHGAAGGFALDRQNRMI